MTRGLSDSHPQAEAVQIALMRRVTPARRFQLLCSLTQTAIFHAKRAIERANVNADRQERDLIHVEVHYGKDVAARLRTFLTQRRT